MSLCAQRSNALFLLEEHTFVLIFTCIMDFNTLSGTVTWIP